MAEGINETTICPVCQGINANCWTCGGAGWTSTVSHLPNPDMRQNMQLGSKNQTTDAAALQKLRDEQRLFGGPGDRVTNGEIYRAIPGAAGPLTDRERQLAVLLSKARIALWREWVEVGSLAAKAAHDATDPVEVV